MDELSAYLDNNGEVQQGIRLIRNSWIINIEVTNHCEMGCTNCTRAARHIRNPFFASLEFIGQALDSLRDWPRGIGIIGGEPQTHPQWDAICQLLRDFNHKGGYALFTSRGLPGKYTDIFSNGKIYLTNHGIKNLHHPLLVSLEEVVPDPELQRELIEKCWLQRLWSPSVTPRGAFWCEVAGVMDLMWDGPGGYSIEPGWWKRESYEDQIERYCKKCGVCIPMELATDKEPYEWVTPEVFERLRECGSPCLNKCRLFTGTLTRQSIESRQENMHSLCFIQERTRTGNSAGKYF